MMRLSLFGTLILLPVAGWSAPAMNVSPADGKVLVRATAAQLAAWRPTPDTLIVAMPADSGETEIGILPAGMSAESWKDGSLAGVIVRGNSGSWNVMQDGANWLLRPGNGLKSESVMLLRDGWHAGADVLQPTTVNVAGKIWQVAMVPQARSVAGSVVGAVRTGGAAPAATAAAPVAAASLTERPDMQAVSAADMTRRAGVDVASTETKEAPALPEMPVRTAPVVSASAAVSSGLAKVPVFKAPAMRPMQVSAGNTEMLEQVIGEIYMPGTVVSLTLPHGATGLGNPEESSKKKGDDHGSIAADGAVAGADGHGASVSETEAVDEPVTAPSSTWNQSTLGPIAAALEDEKVKKEQEAAAEKVVSATPVVVEDFGREPSVTAVIEADDPRSEDDITRLIPARGRFYYDDANEALQAIAEAPADSLRARDAQLRLAGIYLSWQRPEEALAVLRTLPDRDDGLPASPQARLLMGLAQLARGESPKAAGFDQGGELAPHARLWRAVAASRSGDYANALKLWPKERGILPNYPAYLRELAQLAQAQALVSVGDRSVAIAVLDQLAAAYEDPKQVPVALTRLRGVVRLGTPDEAKGLEYLAAAAEDMRDPAEAYRAKFDFVRALYQRRDLVDDQVRAYLTDLWLDWRGDELEREVLGMLADLYDKAGEPREALQHWQILVKAFPRSPDLARITERMTNAFLKVFDPENPKAYDPLAYLGLYYDFSELVPNDARGDRVHEQVAQMLVDANLWERAVPILEQQLQYRKLDAAAQGRLSLMMAQALGNMGRAADGIKIIDKWQHAANTAALKRQWKLLEADLLLKLKRPESVTRALAGMPADDADVRDLRIEAAWQGSNWPAAVPLLQAKLTGVTPAQMVSDTGAQLAAFRLGYAYGQGRDAANLDALTTRYDSALQRLPVLADGLGAVAASTGISASFVPNGPLAPITTALSDVNRQADRVQGLRNAIAGQRREQQEYNDKMRYMELLPPPAM